MDCQLISTIFLPSIINLQTPFSGRKSYETYLFQYQPGNSSHHSCGNRHPAAAMDDNDGNKVTGIRQIVRLKEILQKWQNVTIGPKVSNHTNGNGQRPVGGISPAISKRLRGSNVNSDSDEDGCQSPEPPHDVPKGYLAVYVGPELRRFIIPTSYLSNPLFKVLLEKVEEEFGFDYSGGLTIPCEIETFKYLLKCMENHQKHHGEDNTTSDAGVSICVRE